MDEKLIILSNKKRPQITYIPSCSYDSPLYFEEFVHRFSRFEIYKFLYFPIDHSYNRIILSEAFKSDIIYLSGGNTFYFLKHLRDRKLMGKFKEFISNGGIVAGLSAGAILMTPNIITASIPRFDCDDNEIGLKNFKGLSLVNFEFFPHFKNSKRYVDTLKRYSKRIAYPLYASFDGGGVIIDDNIISFINTVMFFNGKKSLLK